MVLPIRPRARHLAASAAIILVSAAQCSAHPMGKVENIDPRWYEKPPLQLMVPEGATNLALGRPVTCSGRGARFGDLAMVTDGVKDAGEKTTAELPPGKQWVQIDLRQIATIHAIIMWLGDGPGSPRSYTDVIVLASDDADFVFGVATLFSNDHDNSSGLGLGRDYAYIECYLGKWIDAKGVKARYVRIHSNGGTAGPENHFTEVEVWGTRGKPGERMVPLKTDLPMPRFGSIRAPVSHRAPLRSIASQRAPWRPWTFYVLCRARPPLISDWSRRCPADRMAPR